MLRLEPLPLSLKHKCTDIVPAASVTGVLSVGAIVHVNRAASVIVCAALRHVGGVRYKTLRIAPQVKRLRAAAGNLRLRHDDLRRARRASTPPGFSIVAVLSIVVPGVAPAATCTVNMIVALPFAGTLMPVTLSRPVPFAPVPLLVDAFVAPAGTLVTLKSGDIRGHVVRHDDARRRDACGFDQCDRVAQRIARIRIAAVQVLTTVLVEVDRFEPSTVAVSVATLFVASGSLLGVVTCAVFVTLGYAALPTPTVNVIAGNEAPAFNGPGMRARHELSRCAATPAGARLRT